MNNQKRALSSSKTIEILKRIQDTSSTTEKQNLLYNFYREISSLQRTTLKLFFNYVYSPFITFGIKTIPEKLLKSQPKVFLFPISDISEAMDKITEAFLKNKSKGNLAKQELYNIIKACDVDTAKLVRLLIARKLDIGMTTNSINKSIPGCLPSAEYMGAVPFGGIPALEKLVDKYVKVHGSSDFFFLAQEKADGLFAFINVNDTIKQSAPSGSIRSRRLKPIGALFPELKKEIKELNSLFSFDNMIFHGEFTIDGMDRLTSNGVYKALTTIELKKEEGCSQSELKKYSKALEDAFGCTLKELQSRIRYSIWDITSENIVEDFSNGERFQYLLDAFDKLEANNKEFKHIQLIEHEFFKHTEIDKVILYFQQLHQQCKEGIILKLFNGYFKAGKPVHCIKFKNEFSSDYKVVGFERGNGKYKHTLGAIFVESKDGKLKSKVPGFSDDLKDEIWNNQEKYLGKVVEVRANDYSASEDNIDENGEQIYSLMHPRFIEFRQDKVIPNTMEEIIKERNAFKIIAEMLMTITSNEIFKCTSCNSEFPNSKANMDPNTKFLVCPDCGSEEIQKK